MLTIPTESDLPNPEAMLAEVLADDQIEQPGRTRSAVLVPLAAAAASAAVVTGVVVAENYRPSPPASSQASASAARPSAARPSAAGAVDPAPTPSLVASAAGDPGPLAAKGITPETQTEINQATLSIRELLALRLDPHRQHIPASELDPTVAGNQRLSGIPGSDASWLLGSNVTWRVPGASGVGSISYALAQDMTPCAALNVSYGDVVPCRTESFGGLPVTRPVFADPSTQSDEYAFKRSDGMLVVLRLEQNSAKANGPGGSGIDGFGFTRQQLTDLLKDTSVGLPN